jgi:hypothetical protein
MNFVSKIITSTFLALPIIIFGQTTPNTKPAQAPTVSDATSSSASSPVTGASVPAPRVLRIFLQSASKGLNRNAARDQSSEMAKDFERDCPAIKITINQSRADYTVTLNHVEVGLFVRDNQFEVYDADGDRMKGKEGGSIKNGVKGVCALISADWATKTPLPPAGQ